MSNGPSPTDEITQEEECGLRTAPVPNFACCRHGACCARPRGRCYSSADISSHQHFPMTRTQPIATVSISANLTDPNCTHKAQTFLQQWQPDLTQIGSKGNFKIGHGGDGKCSHTHDSPFDGNFWIWSSPRGCNVFLSEEGNPIDYAGAGRDAASAYRGFGHCRCGAGH